MKSIVIIYGNISRFSLLPIGEGTGEKNFFQCQLEEAWNFPFVDSVVVVSPGEKPQGYKSAGKEQFFTLKDWTVENLADFISAKASGTDHCWLMEAGTPFVEKRAAEKLWKIHSEYFAEYTFADGYPGGLFPVVAATGILPSIKEIAKNDKTSPGKDFLFNVMKKDINSFDIETEIAPHDQRSLRVYLNSCTKNGFELCRKLLAMIKDSSSRPLFEFIPELLEKNPLILRGFPEFYYIQVASECVNNCLYCPYPSSVLYEKNKFMNYQQAAGLIDRIYEFSGSAVVSPSLWGEPALNPDIAKIVEKILSYPSLSVCMETSGYGWKPGTIEEIKNVCQKAVPRENGRNPVEWILSLDGTNEEFYKILHPQGNFAEVLEFAGRLSENFPEAFYPQFVRVNENEENLESFYKFWKEKTGRVLIQKYDNFCNNLPDRKPADLSPLIRFPCWHLKRDMVILLDGTVVPCRECLNKNNSYGNVFSEPLEKIWSNGLKEYEKHITENYSSLCGECDEYYTFNF